MASNMLQVPGGPPPEVDVAGNGSAADSDEENKSAMGYQQTLMYGRYSRSLGEYAKEESKRQRVLEKQRVRRSRKLNAELSGKKTHGKVYRTSSKVITYVWKHTFAKIGEDWVFLAVLGILMSVISFLMDYGIGLCGASRMMIYNVVKEQDYNVFLQFLAWVSLPVMLVLFSAGFVHVVAPQAIGSGIPEMKTILRGVVLKEYLTPKTLLAKMVGLTATLGSGMPLGKEGPFVHIASIVATQLTKLVTTFQGIYANESRHSEMLAAACAVGVACCFASPIGGVLFSIEVTSVFFAVRNYWRGFFAAVCGATMFRLIHVITSSTEETITAVFRTDFKVEYPYDPRELICFAGIGVVSGLGGALYVYTHRRYVLWMRGNKKLTKFLQKNRFIYPFSIALFITGVSFPNFLGQFIASTLNTHDQIHDLFSNHSWSDESTISTGHQASMLANWESDYTGIFTNLLIYMLATFVLSILAATLPVPTGVLVPAFKIGAAFGRLVGEGMNVWFPGGFIYDDHTFKHHVVAGGYATVGAASFTAAVTHTISISVIVFEMTGQITHLIPVLISVLISNAIAALLQPSCYDSIILIKKLPYLPDILPSSSKAYNVYVEDFMLRDVKYIWYGMTYRELREVLREGKKLRGFPLVDNPDPSQMILLGSIQRHELIQSIENHIGKPRRMQVAMRRYEARLKKLAQEEQDRLQRLMEVQNLTRKAATTYPNPPPAIELQVEQQPQPEPEQQQQEVAKPAEVSITMTDGLKQRRPSRFEVTTIVAEESSKENTPDPDKKEAEEPAAAPKKEDELAPKPEEKERRPSFLDTLGLDPSSPAMKALMQLSAKPKKSILKKSNSHTIHSFGLPGMGSSARSGPSFTDDNSWRNRFNSTSAGTGSKLSAPSPTTGSASAAHYKTVTGAENKSWRHALDNFQNFKLFKKPSNMSIFDEGPDRDAGDYYGTGGPIDMTFEEQQEWEEEEMGSHVEFDGIHIDPAPFQLVEKTSLLKVHSLFSMLGVNHAYVTTIGRLIGVVGLKELRAGIENANSGNFPVNSPPTPSVTTLEDPEHHNQSSRSQVSIQDDPEVGGDPAQDSSKLDDQGDHESDSDMSDTEMLPKDNTPPPKATTSTVAKVEIERSPTTRKSSV